VSRAVSVALFLEKRSPACPDGALLVQSGQKPNRSYTRLQNRDRVLRKGQGALPGMESVGKKAAIRVISRYFVAFIGLIKNQSCLLQSKSRLH